MFGRGKEESEAMRESAVPVFGTKSTVDAGAMVTGGGEVSDGLYKLRSGTKPAPGTFSLASASAMSQDVYWRRALTAS
jgi:hypothetical protein